MGTVSAFDSDLYTDLWHYLTNSDGYKKKETGADDLWHRNRNFYILSFNQGEVGKIYAVSRCRLE